MKRPLIRSKRTQRNPAWNISSLFINLCRWQTSPIPWREYPRNFVVSCCRLWKIVKNNWPLSRDVPADIVKVAQRSTKANKHELIFIFHSIYWEADAQFPLVVMGIANPQGESMLLAWIGSPFFEFSGGLYLPLFWDGRRLIWLIVNAAIPFKHL